MTTYIQLTDAKVALDDTGEGPPVLLLHGFPATRLLWSQVAPVLIDAGFRVLVPDLVGYGASEAPADGRIDMVSQARWMLELFDVLGVVRPVVVAHDVGSAAAQIMVATAPHRIRGLAVLDGVYAGDWATLTEGEPLWPQVLQGHFWNLLLQPAGHCSLLLQMVIAHPSDLRLLERKRRSAQRNICRDLKVPGCVRGQAVLHNFVRDYGNGVRLRDTDKSARQVLESRGV